MAQYDSEAESIQSVASPSQKFVPEEDDDENLWEVECITAERNNMFKVKWVGLDPMTGKPWAQSWVPKKDCTPDLVLAWKLKKKQEERRKSTASTKGRSSAASSSTAAPRASTSKLAEARQSTSTTREATTARRGRSSGVSIPTTNSPDNVTKSKPKVAPLPIAEADVEMESEQEREDIKSKGKRATTTHGKKHKLNEAQSVNNSARMQSKSKGTPDVEMESEQEQEDVKSKGKGATTTQGKKRKLHEARSANNSAHTPTVNVNINAGIDNEQEPPTTRVVSRPKKKRKVEVDTVKPKVAEKEEEEESTQEAEAYSSRVANRKELVESEEEEERLVEEVLSQGIPTPPRHDSDSSVQIVDVGGKGDHNEDEIDELADDDSVIIVSQPPPKAKSTTKPTNPSPKEAPSPPRKPSPKPRPETSAASTLKATHTKRVWSGQAMQVNTTPRRLRVVDYSNRSESSKSDSEESESTSSKSRSERTDSQSRSRSSRRSKPSNSENDDDSSHSDHPQHSSLAKPRYGPPTEERSVFWEGPVDRDALPDEERLTPRSLARLKQFDREMEALEKEEELNRRRLRKEPSAVQGLLKGAGTSKSSVAQPSTSGHKQAVPSSSKGKWKDRIVELINVDTESEKDLVPPTKQPMSVPDKSSTLMNPSSSNEAVEKPHSKPDSTHPITTSLMREAGDADIRPIASKASKQTDGSSKLTNATKQRVHKPPSNSYEHETIPETEAEESQSQEKGKGKARDIDLTPPGQTYPTLLQPPTPSTPGGRATLRSKMRPKTPLSRGQSMSVTGKPLGPIPQLTPSIFYPHLPRAQQPASSLPESISDVVDSVKHPSSKISTQIDNDGDVQMESIEEFDSPEKPLRPAAAAGSGSGANGHRVGSAEQIWESEVVKRGQEIAEAAKRKAAAEAGLPAPKPKKTLDDIRAAHSRRNSNTSDTHGQRAGPGGLVHQTIVEEDENIQDASTIAIPPASGPRMEDESATLREMEAAYVDLDGGDSQPVPPHVALRQEEEESTQDAMQTRMDDALFQVSKTSSSENAVSQLVLGSDQETNDGGLENIPKIVVQDPSRPASPRPYSDDGLQMANMRTTRSRSRSQTPAVVPQPFKGRGKGKAKATPANSRAGSLAPPSKASSSTSQHRDDLQNRLDTALALVETKSQEIKNLQAQLVSERTASAAEVERLKALNETQENMIASSASRMTDAQEEFKQQLAEAETRNSQLLAEKEEWAAEKLRLLAQLDAATKSRESADKDREFFREQYAQASGYVTSVREDNKELEKRIKIAEEQAQSGVALIKATFEMRVKNLETDLKSWRRMAEFLIEKDKRTDNDELRRRAAEYPELASRCERQKNSIEVLEEEYDDLKEEMDRERAADRMHIERLTKQVTRLNVELNEALTKLDRLGRANAEDESADSNPSANEFVYPCQWRDYDGVESTPCLEVFPTISVCSV
ncbi:hypothetical protein JR316_0011843 [Psilocybe cubensis]|uniref:Chromo domain-containing protein n=2 Tax=Psilocybe cubensis TaxID=181762 RepID=A0A8H7XNC0_PSICU|nr:hypothetical protein JR316_0011843 [Psilocybe cubensis]KAH9476272.1 hypothetical protein JR316_0011843 [Psilocybe cubensis]